MILSLETVLPKVFMIYGAFWVLVVTVLLIVVGPLAKRRDRVEQEHRHGASGKH